MSLLPKPGDKLKFKSPYNMPGHVFRLSVLEVICLEEETHLRTTSCAVIDEDKAFVITDLYGSLWGGDGESYWGANVRVFDLAKHIMRQEFWGEISWLFDFSIC